MDVEDESKPLYNVDAERCAIASMMLCGDNRTLFTQIQSGLSREAFFQPDHQVIFRVLCDMHDEGIAIDGVLLAAELRKRCLLEEVGGMAYLGVCFNTLPSPGAGPSYAKKVEELYRQREAVRVSVSLTARMNGALGTGGTEVAIQDAIKRLWRLQVTANDISSRPIGDALTDYLDSRSNEASRWIRTGFPILDDEYRGLLNYGDYLLIGGRPSMGKSTMVRSMLRSLAGLGTRVGLVAVEEREQKVAGNYLAAETSIENNHVAYGQWTNDQWGKLASAAKDLSRLPMWVTDKPSTIDQVVAAAERMISEHKVEVVAIDHIHLIQSKGDSEELRIRDRSERLKALFKEHKVAGIVAAQLSRPLKGTNPGRPTMQDLRGSGGLEEHADAIALLHRNDYYERGKPNPQIDGLADVCVVKHRNGCAGVATLRAELNFQRFVDSGDQQREDPFA